MKFLEKLTVLKFSKMFLESPFWNGGGCRNSRDGRWAPRSLCRSEVLRTCLGIAFAQCLPVIREAKQARSRLKREVAPNPIPSNVTCTSQNTARDLNTAFQSPAHTCNLSIGDPYAFYLSITLSMYFLYIWYIDLMTS